MNAHDLRLWQKGLAKVQGGKTGELTADERAVLMFFGGPDLLKPRRPLAKIRTLPPANRVRQTRSATPDPIAKKYGLEPVQLPPLEHADMNGKLTFTAPIPIITP